MAAFLYPGVKSLQLVLDRPYDTIRTTDVRDDLVAIKVWYSLTTPFNPNNGEGTLVPSGNSLNVTIPNLTPNTRYYVKYAFVSGIDDDEVDPAGPTGPGSYTVSNQLTAVVLEENISVYGYLTNDPLPIVTATDGTGGDFTNAVGLFKVFNLSTEVTGAGPVYSIKAGSVDSIVGATINAATGVYSCTGLTEDGGNVTFIAVYNGVTIEQVWNVYRALAGETAPLIQLSTPNKEFIYKDQFATTSQTPSTTVTARLVNLTGIPTFTVQAFTRDNTTTPIGNIGFTQGTGVNSNKITITRAQFDLLGITVGTAVVTATLGDVSDVLTLYRINDGTEQITVYLSNESHGIPAYTDGTTTASSYVGSGTTIEVKQGNTYLTVDNSSPYDNGTWTITNIDSNGIVCDTTALVTSQGGTVIDFDSHASMDNSLDSAYIDYTITGKTTSGVAFSIVKRQSFTKSKEGVAGATARSVNLTAARQSFITEKNSTVVAPDTITLTATASNFVNPTYTWLVDNAAPGVDVGIANGNTFAIKKFNPVGVKVVKVTVSEGTFSVFDTFSIYSLREGDDAFVVSLKNENQTISCDSAGQIIGTTQFPLRTTMSAILGTRTLNSSSTPPVTFAKLSYNGGIDSTYRIYTGGTGGLAFPDGTIVIDSLDEEFAEAVFSATVNGVTLTKTLNLNKSFDGADASVVNVTASTQAFIAAKNTEVISPSTITLTATAFNVGAAPNYAWSTSTNGGTTFTAVQTGTSAVYSLASFTSGTTIVKVVVTGGVSTVFDQITIYSLKDGSDGISVGLTNENQTISCTSDGTPIASPLNLNSELVVFRGATRLTSADGVVWSKVSDVGMTSNIVTTTGAITISAISTTTASATYRATLSINGVPTNFDKILTLNKSNNGLTGEGTTQIYTRYPIGFGNTGPSAPPPGTLTATLALTNPQWSATIVGATGTDPLWTSFGKRSAGGNTYTWEIPVLVEGQRGISEPPLKNATGYLYYDIASASAPGTPSAVSHSYNFAVGIFGQAGQSRQYFTGITEGWSNTFSVSDQPSGKMWAVRYSVQETVSGGTQTINISAPFTHQNFNGLVTFTNIDTQLSTNINTSGSTLNTLNTTVGTKVDTNGATTAANSAINNSPLISGKVSKTDIFTTNTTTIDGGKITTGTINANRLNVGNNTANNVNSNKIVIDGLNNNIRVYSGGNSPRVIIGNLTEPAGGWSASQFTSTS
mgnify:CR=1 FL=1